MVNGSFDRNLLAICPIGGTAGRRQASKALFRRPAFPTKSGAADDASAAAISRVWGHTQVGTIVFVTN
jgi:hypothetical protein